MLVIENHAGNKVENSTFTPLLLFREQLPQLVISHKQKSASNQLQND